MGVIRNWKLWTCCQKTFSF